MVQKMEGIPPGAVARSLIHFGDTHIFEDMFASMAGFQIIEDEYEDQGDGTLERELPYAILFIPTLPPIQLEGKDFDAFKIWYDQATGRKRIELASVGGPG